jgi:hypothetical protein
MKIKKKEKEKKRVAFPKHFPSIRGIPFSPGYLVIRLLINSAREMFPFASRNETLVSPVDCEM